MSIIEQVKELRAYSNASLYARENKARELLKEAADTIESLSEKLHVVNNNNFYEVILHNIAEEIISMRIIWSELEKPPYNEFEQEVYLAGLRKARDIILQAANMERSADDCDGWIPCSERLPEEKINPITKEWPWNHGRVCDCVASEFGAIP